MAECYDCYLLGGHDQTDERCKSYDADLDRRLAEQSVVLEQACGSSGREES